MFKFSRLRLGLSQVRFAKMLGLPRTTYQSYEHNRRKPSKAKEKQIRKKIKEIERRLKKLEKKSPNYLVFLIDILVFLLTLLWILK
jgi:transcriptional regulator with XRE-family HTH domain